MSCCGTKRETWRGKSPELPQAQASDQRVVYFRYLGNKALTVVGSISGRTYQFWGSGAAAAADPRDAPSMAAVPHLMRVPYP